MWHDPISPDTDVHINQPLAVGPAPFGKPGFYLKISRGWGV